ncbi:alpha/beta hydrolase family protein [Shewanella sp. GXUN23E]|uniref:alpha/beta hydrolase family protein n=1 Tax=Shewanella sp. GXUN23E TaxID=3422498 RepID=UPI003D7E2CE2
MRSIFALTATLLLLSPFTAASEYQTPPTALQQVVEQPGSTDTLLSKDKRWLAVLGNSSSPDISVLTQPEVRLAGLRINPVSLTPSRPDNSYQSLTLIQLNNKDNLSTDIPLPTGITLSHGGFSPDGRFFSFTGQSDSGAWPYIVNLTDFSVTRLGQARLNATLSGAVHWLTDGSAMLVRLTVAENFIPRAAATDSLAPLIKATSAQKAPRRTYQDLLKTPADAAYFRQLTLTQLALLSPDGALRKLGSPAIFNRLSLSPDNRYILTGKLTEPFSLRVKYQDFSQQISILRLNDGHEQLLTQLPSGEHRPAGPDSVTPGGRNYQWHPAMAAAITWISAADQGDSTRAADIRDRLNLLSAPFEGEPVELTATPRRIAEIDWIDAQTALITQTSRKAQQITVSLLDKRGLTLWHQRALRDSYDNPGVFHTRRNEFGRQLLAVEDGQVLHFGLGASDQGYRPFLKRTSLIDGRSSKLWQTREDKYERVKYVLNEQPLQLIISSESRTAAPALYQLDVESGTRRLLYQQADALSAFRDIQKQLISFRRADGLPLSGTLYLPADYTPAQGPLPVLMWAYPREYKDKSVAAQVAFSEHQYLNISPRSPIAMVSQGYAVFDRVAMPIIGEGSSKPNDSFRQQLIANAEAAVNVLVEMGVADPKRIAVGGHSYGAFMVANLLAHTDLFAAGIARSGAYNRSLTPFGFQNEERNYWQATALYQSMSPFAHANQINEPILLIHGELDANSGTFPMQSERLFNAIAGLGGTARLVILPWESHSYVAKESLNHLLWEQLNWLDSYLKSTPASADAAVPQGAL